MSKQVRINLAYLRFARGRVSQKAVSEATGIGQKTLSALETGSSKGIEFNTLLRLCEFFNCTPNELFVLEDEPEDVPVSNESRQKAKELVARGLQKAMQTPVVDPKEVWAQFDALRSRMSAAAQRAQGAGRAAKENRLTKRA